MSFSRGPRYIRQLCRLSVALTGTTITLLFRLTMPATLITLDDVFPLGEQFYPTSMPPVFHHDFAAFRAQLQADQEAGILAPYLTFGRWMAAQYFLTEVRRATAAAFYPPRRPTLCWRFFPDAHRYLLRYLGAYQSLGLQYRRTYLQHVVDDLLANNFLMEQFEEAGFSVRDIQRVSAPNCGSVACCTEWPAVRRFHAGSET